MIYNDLLLNRIEAKLRKYLGRTKIAFGEIVQDITSFD